MMNEKSCQSKITFDSLKAAQAAATTAGYQHGSKLKAYRCRICDLWHLTSDYEQG